MPAEPDDELDLEFDRYAGWQAEAIARLPTVEAIAAACQGSANPAALDWLADHLEVDDSAPLLDVGGGLGGPAAWLGRRTGPPVVVAEPMVRAATEARRIFGLTSIASWAHRLPFAPGTFRTAWALGVLDTTPDKVAVLHEVRRVVAPAGRFGILSYELGPDQTRVPKEAPEGNDFPTAHEVEDLLARTGWEVLEVVAAADLDAPPDSWRQAGRSVDRFVERAHGDDPGYATIVDQQRRLAGLLDRGQVRSRLYALRRSVDNT